MNRYELRAAIDYEEDCFITTITESFNRLYLFNELESIAKVSDPSFHEEKAIYISIKRIIDCSLSFFSGYQKYEKLFVVRI